VPEDETTDCFADISNSPYARDICFAAKKGWLQGGEGANFYPDRSLTRAGGIKFILRFFGERVPEKSIASTYKDVQVSDWVSVYVEYAKRNGIIDKKVTMFYPNREISLQEMNDFIEKVQSKKEY